MSKLSFFKDFNILPKKHNSIFFALCIFIFTFCCFGGAEPDLNFNLALMFISGVFLIFALAFSNFNGIFDRSPIYLKYLFAAPIVLPLIQLIPIPADILMHFPGQQLRFEVLNLVNGDLAWHPLSLAPKETAYTAAMSIFFVGFLIACTTVERRQFNFLVIAVIIIAVLGTLIGALQSSDAYPFLRFYEYAHKNAVIGFYANKNHMALTLSVSLLLSKTIFDQLKWKFSRFLFLAFTAFIFVSVIATNSRAGIALVIAAIIFTNYNYLKNIPIKILLLSSMFLAVVFYYILSSAAFNVVYTRFYDVGADGRWGFLVNSSTMLRDFLIFGSGYGSFSTVYMTREGIDAVSAFYTNQLHNDFLQIIIEGGLLALVTLALLVFSIFKAWRASSRSPSSRAAAQTGISVIILFAAHSVVDYPLRRPAAIVYFCIGLAYLIRELLSTEELSPKQRTSIAKRLTLG
jgi:O-antigen ligase